MYRRNKSIEDSTWTDVAINAIPGVIVFALGSYLTAQASGLACRATGRRLFHDYDDLFKEVN